MGDCVCRLFVLLSFFLLPCATQAPPAHVCKGNNTLSVLNILPYPTGRDDPGWDRAFELLPASELAVEQINNRSDILPGYKLEIINLQSEDCGLRVITNGLIETYASLLDTDCNIAGVVGLFCSSVTEVIAPLVARSPFDYVTVAGSTSIAHRNVSKYPRLHHAISSAGQYGKTVVKLMEVFGWENINIVHDSSAFFVSSASTFTRLLEAKNYSLASDVVFTSGDLSQVVPLLQTDRAKVVYFHGIAPDAAYFMCQEYKHNRIWPQYVHIFHDRVLGDFLDSTVVRNVTNKADSQFTCTRQEMLEAVEGIFLLRYQLEKDPNLVLESGITFENYRAEYLKRLNETQMMVNDSLDQENIFASGAYDEVWALALALNNSLDELESSYNLTLRDYRRVDNRTLITKTVQKELLKLSFQGAAGYVAFDENHETSTSIDIHHVINGTDVLVGAFAPHLNENALTLIPTFNKQDIPSDLFEEIPRPPHLPTVVLITVLTILCYLFTTFNLLLLVVYRKDPTIKAVSLSLSMLVFVGCYLIFTTVLFQSAINGISVFTVVCILENWCLFNGLNLIFATMFLRLLRLRQIFKAFGKTGRLWSDKYIFLGVLLICFIGDLLLVIWAAVDKIYRKEERKYIANIHPPFFQITSSCDSNHFQWWVGFSLGYSMVVLTLAVLMAIMTRHIKLSNFKDTKKINAYAFACVGIIGFGVPLSFILRNSSIGKQLTISLSLLLVGVLCQAFIFAPKTFPLLFCTERERQRRVCRRKESQFAMTSGSVNLSSYKSAPTVISHRNVLTSINVIEEDYKMM